MYNNFSKIGFANCVLADDSTQYENEKLCMWGFYFLRIELDQVVWSTLQSTEAVTLNK